MILPATHDVIIQCLMVMKGEDACLKERDETDIDPYNRSNGRFSWQSFGKNGPKFSPGEGPLKSVMSSLGITPFSTSKSVSCY